MNLKVLAVLILKFTAKCVGSNLPKLDFLLFQRERRPNCLEPDMIRVNNTSLTYTCQ
jgi:hypothetical protein